MKWRHPAGILTVVACLAAVAGCSKSQEQAQSQVDAAPQGYDGFAETSQYIDSYDGTKLAITIRRPSRGGHVANELLPVIVTQDRSGNWDRIAEQVNYFTAHGYVMVAQDRRGTGASFGVQTGFVNGADALDARAVIEWAGTQDFSNGKVVAMGCSNQGAWQYVTAALAPKQLVAIAPSCASPQFFDDALVKNGVPIFKTGERHYAGECEEPTVTEPVPPGYEPRPVKPVDADTDGAMLAAAQAEQKCKAPFLGQYWLNMSRDALNTFAGYRPGIEDTAMSRFEAVRASGIAILQIGGWFDAAVAGQFEGQKVWGGRVIMAPWVHGNRLPLGADLPNGMFDLNETILRWFDFHAKGKDNGADKPPIRYYTINGPTGDEWREAESWPPVASKLQRFYLTEDGLSVAKPAADGPEAVYPQEEVVWFEGEYAPLHRWWGGDMSVADAKSLSHRLEAFVTDTEITGTPTARLWISADVPDVNVFAVLEDVATDQTSHYVTDGRLRASWRKLNEPPWGESDEHWHRGYQEDIEPLVPGEPTELVFDFSPTSYVFKAGHSMRISIVTSIGKPFQASPLAEGKPPVLTLYRDARHASAVDVPILTRP